MSSCSDADLEAPADADEFKGEVVYKDAFSLVEIPEGCMQPLASPAALARYGVEPGNLRKVDPLLFGTRILRAQRELTGRLVPDGPEVHHIGGYVMLTSVTKHGVSQRKGGRWHDEVGERILVQENDWHGEGEAALSEASAPVATAGMSREQRRRLERMQRKAQRRAA